MPELYDGQNPFIYHAPSGDQVRRIENIRSVMTDAFNAVKFNVPDSAERTLAIRKLEEASMWANKAITFEKAE